MSAIASTPTTPIAERGSAAVLPLVLNFPDIDPIAVRLGPVAIRWYALAYISGIVLGWLYMRWLATRSPKFTTKVQVDDFLIWATLGIVLGGRLGYVVFYNAGYYLQHPVEILYLWQGGMSFHGGLLGVVLAIYLYSRKLHVRFTTFGDLVCMAVPIGLFFGRIANFVNGELFGRASDVSWAIIFPAGGAIPRHPSQLYEAALEGLLLFLIMFAIEMTTRLRERSGFVSGVFVAGYGVSRFVVEFFREPDAHLGTLALGLSMGQWLSLPMVLIGGAMMLWSLRRV
ncbi:MAG: prolipoprotein diacylglyceryl transferase [Alphaproteobacteria bacterium]|nr:prolipoprotein diacylglyceryl transferase [Alphaproteobacteria bacterium]